MPSDFHEGPAWYCVRTKRFTERRATASMRTEVGLDVFCPMLRYERPRSTGKVWVCEALFPNYLFARMDYAESHRHVLSIRGVLRIVRFGETPLPVADAIIEELRNAVQEEETIILKPRIDVGQEIEVIRGPFQGLRTIVTRIVPAKERVAILLDLLGSEREVEISTSDVIGDKHHPLVS